MNDFLTMGGYGFYVWSAYGLSFLLLIGCALVTVYVVRARQKIFSRLLKQYKNKSQEQKE